MLLNQLSVSNSNPYDTRTVEKIIVLFALKRALDKKRKEIRFKVFNSLKDNHLLSELRNSGMVEFHIRGYCLLFGFVSKVFFFIYIHAQMYRV